MTKVLLSTLLTIAVLAIPTASYAGSTADKVFKAATVVSNTAKAVVTVAKVVAPPPLKPVVKLIDANIKVYEKVGCQLGKVVYGSGC